MECDILYASERLVSSWAFQAGHWVTGPAQLMDPVQPAALGRGRGQQLLRRHLEGLDTEAPGGDSVTTDMRTLHSVA